MRRFLVFVAIFLLAGLLGLMAWRWPYQARSIATFSMAPPRFSRPYGMAPAAFDGFVRACGAAKIHPYRIGQTIGNHPLSVGYHHRDGVIQFRGENIEYTAAVDVAADDLTRPQLNNFLESLAKQGFAAWYREGGKWRGREHIHAIYAPLRMKWQLQSQMRDWESARRRSGKPRLRWQRSWGHNWR